MATYNVGLKQSDLENKIEKFISDIKKNNMALSKESIWLFVATLGCYSVEIDSFKLIALTIVIIFYGLIIEEKKAHKELYSETIRYLKLCIDNGSIDGNEQVKLAVF